MMRSNTTNKTIGNSISGTHNRVNHGRSSSNKKGAGALLLCLGAIAAFLAMAVAVSWYHVIAHAPTTTSRSGSGFVEYKAGKPSSSKNSNAVIRKQTDAKAGQQVIERVRSEFYERYGGREAALELLQHGVQKFGKLQNTAERLLQTAAAGKGEPFVLSFAGYSVTVGRGNHLHQSYPFVLERILKPVLQQALGLDITVRNAAIGGIPSFPYGFCFEHFLGSDSDVVSWDFSMNEGAKYGASVVESYVRQSQSQLPHRPMMILLDTNRVRCKLVKDYADLGLIQDGLCVGMAKDAVKDKAVLELPDDDPKKPAGFRKWNEFGAAPSCPGRGSWHPKKGEHELIGWMMVMYFVEAIELAHQIMLTDSNWQETYQNDHRNEATGVNFPKPLQPPPDNDPAVTDLLFGHVDLARNDRYIMKQLSCRTNFLPATDQDKVLPSIVVSGLAPEITADNIMQERSDETYATGWVLDVSHVERETKVKVEKCGGLGYIDMKIALYGIPESGPLRLWLPVEVDELHNDHAHDNESNAKHWFDEIIICEANEKRKEGACQLDKDIEYMVGGVKVESTRMLSGAAEYLKRQTCVHVGVPEGAQVTRLQNVKSMDGTNLTAESRRRLGGNSNLDEDHVGLIVDVVAKPNVSREKGACCLSHVVWEQH